MKTEMKYDEFEKLLLNKAFSELNPEESAKVLELVSKDEYENMRNLLTEVVSELKSDAQTCNHPPEGSATIWKKFNTDKKLNSKKISIPVFFSFKIPAWIVSSAAAVLLIGVFILRPSVNISFQEAEKANRVLASFNIKNDTVIIEKEIGKNNTFSMSTPLPAPEPAGTGSQPVYITPPGVVQTYSTSKAGTNASELGEKSSLTVSIP